MHLCILWYESCIMYNFYFTGIISNIVALPFSLLWNNLLEFAPVHRLHITDFIHNIYIFNQPKISFWYPHIHQLDVHGRGVEAAAGGQHSPQRGLHTLRHADLAADVEVPAPPADRYSEGTRY